MSPADRAAFLIIANHRETLARIDAAMESSDEDTRALKAKLQLVADRRRGLEVQRGAAKAQLRQALEQVEPLLAALADGDS